MLATCVYIQDEFVQQKETLHTKVPSGPGGSEPHDRPQQETLGGYDCEFVEPPPSTLQTDCPICKTILRDPYEARCCGYKFCRTCIERVQAEHAPCPTCREENFEVFQNGHLNDSLNQLHVLCTHSKDDCMWTGKLGELENHLSEVVHSGEPFQHECG